MAKTFPTILSSLSFPAQEQAKSLISYPIPATKDIISSLKSCSNIRQFSPIHAHLITTNLIHDPIMASHVLWFFVSRENSQYAHRVFSQNQELETIVWNTLLENHLRDGCLEGVFLTYSHMVTQGVSLDISTFHFLIHACCRDLDSEKGTEIHGRVIKSGMGRNKSLNNNLMGFYTKLGKLDEVRQLFDKMPHRDVITWNTMISCYVQMGLAREALGLFREMRAHGVAADEVTMVSLLSACSKLRDLETGERLLHYVEENGLKVFGNLLNCLVNMYIECGKLDRAHELVAQSKADSDDVVLWTSLVGGYVKAGKIQAARYVFDRIADKTLISWSIMISGYTQSGHYHEGLELFRQMRLENLTPNEVIIVTALSASSRARDFRFGRSIHGLLSKLGMVENGLLGNSLVHFYVKSEEPNDARSVFEGLTEKSVSSWNSMLEGLCRSGDIDEAKSFFEKIPEKDVVSWNTLINSLAKSRRFGELFELFREMVQGSTAEPDRITLIGVLSSIAGVGALRLGMWAHAYVERNNIAIEEKLGTALVDMYGKCGGVEKARELFDSLGEKNVFVFTAMMSAYSVEGRAEEAIEIFSEMESMGIKPDRVTFVALLSACSHSGLVSLGLEYFYKMRSFYEITPDIEHYGCAADLLGRAGRLDEALEFIQLMPIEPDVAMWSAFLSACGTHRNVELAEHAFRRLVGLDPRNDSAHVLLSNIYARAGRLEDQSRIRTKMFKLGIKKKPGISLIEQNGVLHEFAASDFSNLRSQEIYALLDGLKGELEELGVEEKSAHHSERLAVAFGLISNSETNPIRVVNNVRICGDCHSAMKLVSRVYDREIVIRDNYRFHRFVDGKCSCKDHW